MYRYLALGDSYTIGEQVSPEESFPYQTVHRLRQENYDFSDPMVIAKTGWTTDELMDAIEKQEITTRFDLVTLLIGVNNQYRNYPLGQFKKEFGALLEKAVDFSKNGASSVFVLSIPDWGVTPFAEGKDRQEIAAKIDEYNSIKKSITEAKGCSFLNITDSTRRHGKDHGFLTPDLLHYSSKEYELWAERLVKEIMDAKK